MAIRQVDNETRKQRQKQTNQMVILLVGITLMIIGAIIGSYMASDRMSFFDAFMATVKDIGTFHFSFKFNHGTIIGSLAGIIITAFVGMNMIWETQKRDHFDPNAVAGTGGFMTQKDLADYREKYFIKDPPPVVTDKPIAFHWPEDEKKYSQNMIMSQHFTRPINSRRLTGNNNVLVVGGAGTGKSRFFMKPNVLQMNASYVITDPSGEMIKSLGKPLRDHGYRVKVFNITNMQKSNTYNPLMYIRDEAGVNMVIECLISNTTKGKGGGDNEFFVNAEKLLYAACIFYLIDFCQDDTKKNFAGVINMINASHVDENNANAKSPLDKLFDALPRTSLAWKYYNSFKQAAGKTLKSIIISCVTRLQPFLTPQVVNLTKTDELELQNIGNEKTALFIITPQADRTYSFLASMLYCQLFETLYHVAEEQLASGGSEQLHIPVRCLMDEFANIGTVPEFPSRLATMRKYNISAAVILQDTSQIEAMYKDEWKTIVGNCSTIIFLGSQEPNTLKYFSDMLGKQTIRVQSESQQTKGNSRSYQRTGREVMTPDELGRMDPKKCIVYTYGFNPVLDDKYHYEEHPYYPMTADIDDKEAAKKNAFLYAEMSAYDNSSSTKIASVMKAKTESARVLNEQAKQKDGIEDLEQVQTKDPALRSLDTVTAGSEKKKEMSYAQHAMEAQIQALSQKESPYIKLRFENMPLRFMARIVDQLQSITGDKPIMAATSITATAKDKRDYMMAIVAIDPSESGFLDILDNDIVISSAQKNGVMLMQISQYRYDEYLEAVDEAWSNGHAA